MAEYHVNNGDDFIEKANTLTTADTIILDNDIDFNYRTGEIIVKCNIDGKGHSLYNIQSEDHGLRIGVATELIIKNVSFKNILSLSQSGYFVTYASGVSTLNVTFENCQFQGKWGCLSSRSTTAFRKCYFELSLTSKSAIALNTTFYYCYINIINFTLSSGNYSLFGNRLDKCYIKGNINITSGTHKIADSCLECVFNFDLTTPSSNIGCYASTSNTVNIYNSDKMFVTSTHVSMIPCTDTEMHNAQAIFDKGFPIVV